MVDEIYPFNIMFNMLVQPEKIVNFDIQNDVTYYQVRWIDSWVPQTSLSPSWQHLIEAFWKKQTEAQNEQQQLIQPRSQSQQPPENVGNRYNISTLQNNTNKFLPNFSSLLVNNNHISTLTPLETTTQLAHQQISAKQPALTNPVLTTLSVPEQQQHMLSTSLTGIPLRDQVLPTNELTSVSSDFQINSLLEQSQAAFQLINPPKETDVVPTTTAQKQSAVNNKNNTKTRVVRKVKPKVNAENDDNSDQVKCSECSREFSQTMNPRKRLREHVRRVHLKNGKFKCSHCQKTFVCRQGLRDHEPVHSKERKHSCSYCSQTFLRQSHLYIHTRTHEEEKNFRCEACFTTFNVQSELKDHCDNTHLNITVDIKCSVCKQNLFSSQSIYSHSLRHSGTRDWKCDECGAAFKRKQILDQHKKRHELVTSERKNIKCEICSKDFTTRSILREHVFLVHNTSLEGADYKCEVCGKCFRNWANYDRHVNLHPKIKEWGLIAKEQEETINKNEQVNEDEVKDFTCDACRANYTGMSDFLKHLKQHQLLVVSVQEDVEEGELENGSTVEGAISCDVCSKTFSGSQYMGKHKEGHGALELKCDVCFMIFKRRDTLRIHKKRHIERNETPENFHGKNGEIYNRRKELRANIGDADSNGRVTCPYCKKIFKNRKLLLSHIVLHGDVSFTCETCGKSYKQRSCFNKHKRTHASTDSAPKRGRPQGTKDGLNNDTSKMTKGKVSDAVTGKEKYKCTVCYEGFVSLKVLNEHGVVHTSMTINCGECTLTFVNKETFERHLKASHKNENKNSDDTCTESM